MHDPLGVADRDGLRWQYARPQYRGEDESRGEPAGPDQ